MDTKEKTTNSNLKRNSTPDSDDSSKIFPVIKRKRKYIFGTTSSEDSIPSNVVCSVKQENCGTGPQSSLTNESQPIDYFNMFVDSFLLTSIVRETNRYAVRLIKTLEIDEGFQLRSWEPVTLPEIKAFIAVLLEMGITKRQTFFCYWSKNSRSIPWFSKMFSKHRFRRIYRCFHLIDKKKCFPAGHKKYKPCLKLMPIIEHTNRVCKLISAHASNDDVIVIKKRNKNEGNSTRSCSFEGYNIHMRGIDRLDTILYVYLDERRMIKYWKKIAFHIISYMVSNSYILYREINKKKSMSQLKFTSSIISEIENEWMRVRKKYIAIDNNIKPDLMKLRGRNLKQCAVCNTKIDCVKRSNLICMQCKKGLHPLCFHKHVCFKNNECRNPVKQ